MDRKGQPAWNKGLTAQDPRVQSYVEKRNATMIRKYGTKGVIRRGKRKITIKFRKKMSEIMQRRSKLTLIKMSLSAKKRWEREREVIIKHQTKGKLKSQKFMESFRKMSLATRLDSWKEKVSHKLKGRHTSPATEFKKGHKPSEATRQQISNKHKTLWANPEYAKWRLHVIKPNKSEIRLLEILRGTCNNWEYTGDGKLIVNGKCPDFSDNNGRLIEFFGKRWHESKDELERVSIFKKMGFNTLIIWDYELKDLKLLTEKISNFNNSEVNW